ncbi:MAG TPA: hypothetical protein VHC97_24715 [Thermoanaerobaculia bacterium]|nr:hypothetical protein [Thermoanaerobaculia bacterium]
MSHERTVEQFTREVEHITGVRLRIGWIPFYGIYLEDTETGNRYALGKVTKKDVLRPREQESLCRGLHREHWIVLLGLDSPQA